MTRKTASDDDPTEAVCHNTETAGSQQAFRSKLQIAQTKAVDLSVRHKQYCYVTDESKAKEISVGFLPWLFRL